MGSELIVTESMFGKCSETDQHIFGLALYGGFVDTFSFRQPSTSAAKHILACLLDRSQTCFDNTKLWLCTESSWLGEPQGVYSK